MAEQSKTFCPLPFIHSHASVNGKWKPCCNSDWNHTVKTSDSYFINDKNHQSWFYGPEMDQLRSDMLSGVQNPMCSTCWKMEKTSGKSIRRRYNTRFNQYVDIENPKIKYLDLKLSNECNLACRMCDYTNSNKIYKDILGLVTKKMYIPENWERSPRHEQVIDSNGIKTTPKHILDEIESLLPNLRVLKLTGGEPTIIPEVLKLFDICIKKGYAKNLQLNLTTNGTKFTQRFLDRMKEFKDVYLNVSCDGYGKVYDYIRHPFNWQKLDQRVRNIKTYGVGASITVVPQMYNIENLTYLQKWGSEVGITVSMNNFLTPSTNYNALGYVPVHILKEAKRKIKRNNDTWQLISIMDKHIRDNYTPTEDEYIKIVKSVDSIDTIRNQSYKDYLEPMTVEWLEGLFKQYA